MMKLSASFWTSLLLAAALAWPATARAQVECAGGACGMPYESGGGSHGEGEGDGSGVGNGGCGGGSLIIANTDMGNGYQYADDFDVDGWEDDFDNCPFAVNPDQSDVDGDGFGNACDNCPSQANADQLDADGDRMGNACDEDADNDSVMNDVDSCPLLPNPMQGDDIDGDGLGNPCDQDDDGDGELDVVDPCPLLPGVNDPMDDRCDRDSDDDGIPDSVDLCWSFASDDNLDTDRDGVGDACDLDLDNDGVPNMTDNCRETANPGQLNADRDGFGDACDSTFCFVVDAQSPNSCLDPMGRFFGRSGPDLAVQAGEEVRLRIFTNRPNAPTHFVWKVSQAPAQADYQVSHATGTVNVSSPWEFHYQRGKESTFVAHTPGTYQVELQTELVFGDDLFPGLHTDRQVQTIVVQPKASGCSAGGTGSVFGLLALLGLWPRRRPTRRG